MEESLSWLLKQRAVGERVLESLPLLDSFRFPFIEIALSSRAEPHLQGR